MSTHLIEILEREPGRIDEVVAGRTNGLLRVLGESLSRGQAGGNGRQWRNRNASRRRRQVLAHEGPADEEAAGDRVRLVRARQERHERRMGEYPASLLTGEIGCNEARGGAPGGKAVEGSKRAVEVICLARQEPFHIGRRCGVELRGAHEK